MDIKWLTPQIAFSGCIGYDADMANLAKSGFTGIIAFFGEEDRCHDAGFHNEKRWAKKYGIPVHRIPVHDDKEPWTVEMMQAAFDFAKSILLVEGKGRLLVHCMAGRGRSPAMAYGILVSVLNADRKCAETMVCVCIQRTIRKVYKQSIDAFIQDLRGRAE